ALQDARLARRLEAAIDDDPQRLARRIDLAHRELRIVGAHRADAGEDRAGARAPAMAVAPRLGAGNPLRVSIGKRRAAVERRGDLHPHPGPAARDARDEADVELARLLRKQPVLEANAGSHESFANGSGLAVRIAPRGTP